MRNPSRASVSGEFYGHLDWGSVLGPCAIRSLRASGREEDVEDHTHEEAHFVLVLSGTYVSTARGAPDYAPGPFLVFNPAGTTHRDRFRGGVGGFVTFSLPSSAVARASDFRLAGAATALSDRGALAAALGIAREIRGAGADCGVLEAGVWELVAAAGRPASDERLSLPGWVYAAFTAIMDRSADGRLTVGAVAADAGVHPVHLARVFRRAWGCSPGELLRWRRSEEASRLLLRTRWPVAEIAAAVGFADQSHMTRAFATAFGATPAAWRRAHDVASIQAMRSRRT